MEDLASQIGQLLSSKEGMQQIQNAAAALGLGGGGNGGPPAPAASAPEAGGGGFDLNQLMGILSQMGQSAPNTSPPQPMETQPPAAPSIDVAQIASILNKLGLGSPGSPEGNVPSIDLNMMMQVQRAMQHFAAGNKNVDLLRSLKPHFSEGRQKKVDDAIKIMQLIHILPMLKETGLFGWGGDKQ